MNAAQPWSFLFLLLLLGLFLGIGGGCSSSVDLEGRDDDVIMPALRVTLDFRRPEKKGFLTSRLHQSPESPNSSEGVAPGEELSPVVERTVETSFGIDFDLTFGSGDSSQTIRAGQTLEMGGLDINGPARISHEYDLYGWSVAVRSGFWIDGYFGIEGLAGLGFEHLDVEVSSGSLKNDDQEFYVGPIIGGQISLNPLSWATLYGRGTITFGVFEDPFNSTAAEVGVSFSIHRKMTVFGGWRWWDLEAERGSDSDIELELSGPTFGLQINL